MLNPSDINKLFSSNSSFGATSTATKNKKLADMTEAEQAAYYQGQVSSKEDTAAKMGINTQTDKPSILDRIFGVMDAAGSPVRALVHNATNSSTDQDVSVLGQVGNALTGKKTITGADIVKDWGVKNKIGDAAGGFALDVLLDPVTYLTFGAGSITKAKAATKAVELVGDVSKAGKALDAAEAADKAVQALSKVSNVATAVKGADTAVDTVKAAAKMSRAVKRAEETSKAYIEHMAGITSKYGNDIADAVKDVRTVSDIKPDVANKIVANLVKQTEAGLETKGGVKLLGHSIPGTEKIMDSVALKAKNFVATNEKIAPVKTALDTLFGAGKLTPITEINALTKTAAKEAVRKVAADSRTADALGKEVQMQIARLIPDEGARTAATIGIGRQAVGKEAVATARNDIKMAEKLRALVGKTTKFDSFVASDTYKSLLDSGMGEDVLKQTFDGGTKAADDLIKTANKALDVAQDAVTENPNAVADALGAYASKSATPIDVSKASDVIAEQQGKLSSLHDAKVAAGINEQELYPTLGAAKGYVPGVYAGGMSDDAVKALDSLGISVKPEELYKPDAVKDGIGKVLSMGKPKQEAKTFIDSESRLANGLMTETDIAKLLGGKTAKDYKEIARQGFINDMKDIVPVGDEKMAELVKYIEQPFTSDVAMKNVLKTYDKVLGTWKMTATSLNAPRFQMRNAMSNKFLMASENLLSPKSEADSMAFIKRVSGVLNNGDISKLAANDRKYLGQLLDDGVIQTKGDLLQLIPNLDGKVKGATTKVGKAFEKYVDLSGYANELVENQSRISAYMTAVKKGLDGKSAANLVDTALFNYSPEVLTSFENNFMKRIVPFYTWARRNTPHAFKILVTNPKMYTIPQKAINNTQNAFGVDNSILPSWLKEAGMLATPFKDKNGDTTLIKTDAAVPMAEMRNVLDALPTSLSPGENIAKVSNYALAGMSPLLSLPIELANNMDSFKKTQIKRNDQSVADAPSQIQALVNAVPQSKAKQTLLSYLGMYEEPQAQGAAKVEMDPYTAHVIDKLAPVANSIGDLTADNPDRASKQIGYLTGLRPYTYTQDKYAADTAKTRRDELQRMITLAKNKADARKTLLQQAGGK